MSKIHYKRVNNPLRDLVCYVDASFGGCKDNKKSTTGYVTFVDYNGRAKHLVDWSSITQKAVSTSTCEAELAALHEATKASVLPISQFLEDVQGTRPKTKVYEDNLTTIRKIDTGFSPVLMHMSKTHEVSLAWLHEIYKEKGLLDLHYIPTKDNAADIMTKGLSGGVIQTGGGF